MTRTDITKTELVWPGKYNEDGTCREVPHRNLPFQVIEAVNDIRTARVTEKTKQITLFDIWKGDEGETFESGWKNKLIWGDNLLVMASLLDKFAGKIDLIYIDPPFATGADFSFMSQIGDGNLEIAKEQSIIEEKAYRDTWGRGLDSYLMMLYERLQLMRQLLSPNGSIYVHLGPNMSHYVKILMDQIFGMDNYRNEIIWQRFNFHADANRYGIVHDSLLFYSKSEEIIWNPQRKPLEQSYVDSHFTQRDKNNRKYRLDNALAKGQGPARRFGDKMLEPPAGTHWRWGQESIDKLMAEGRIVFTSTGRPAVKRYLDEIDGAVIHSIWTDIKPLNSQASERLYFETQKPEALLERIIKTSSNEGDIVADFFDGSGTTPAVAEKLGRRWIGCDLGRFAIHTTRKRLLEIDGCKPFEVLNLGKYERQYWQISITEDTGLAERSLYEYLAFILRLYGAQPVAGLSYIHGKKGRAMVHIGSVDAPVTIDEISAAIDECARLRQPELHVLGWEWEMGLAGPNNDYKRGSLMHDVSKEKGVKLILLQIPRDVMEQQAVDKGDIQFFELAYLDVEINTPKRLTVAVSIKDFVIPNTDLIPEEVRAKVSKWSDYIDYWALDWDFRNDTFIQGWVAYRTRQDRSLPLKADRHTYEKPGKYRILVKVVDIFGNDTSQAYDVQVV